MKKRSQTGMSRRDFLACGGGTLLLMSAGAAAVTPKPKTQGKASRQPLVEEGTVLLVVTDSRKTGVQRTLELLPANPFKGRQVLVKPNFNTSDICPGSTHNDTLSELLARIRDMGGTKLAIGDRSGPEPTELVLQRKGIRELAKEFAAEVINFDELGSDGYIKVKPPHSHWADGFLVARPAVEGECVVSTCCLKTHGYGGVFTMSLKNSVGIVPRQGHPYMRQLHNSPHQRRMIAEVNWTFKPVLVVLDGIEVFVDKGPMKGPRKNANVFLAGSDRVAIDAVGVAILKELGSNADIMGKKIFEQEQIARAVELGLGVAAPDRIKIVTADEASEAYAKKVRTILASG